MVLFSWCLAIYHGSFEIRISFDVDIEAVFSCVDACLVGDALVVAIYFPLIESDTASGVSICNTGIKACAHGAGMAIVVVSILLALYIEVSADIGNNLIPFRFASEDICIFAAFYSERLVCGDGAAPMGDPCTIFLLFSAVDISAHGDRQSTAKGHTEASALAGLACGIGIYLFC